MLSLSNFPQYEGLLQNDGTIESGIPGQQRQLENEQEIRVRIKI